MKALLDAGLLVVWVWLYLAGMVWIARYRRARTSAVTARPGDGYRADKDVGLRLLTFLLGLVLIFAVYLVSRVTGER
jgi:hypothetical protein